MLGTEYSMRACKCEERLTHYPPYGKNLNNYWAYLHVNQQHTFYWHSFQWCWFLVLNSHHPSQVWGLSIWIVSHLSSVIRIVSSNAIDPVNGKQFIRSIHSKRGNNWCFNYITHLEALPKFFQTQRRNHKYYDTSCLVRAKFISSPRIASCTNFTYSPITSSCSAKFSPIKNYLQMKLVPGFSGENFFQITLSYTYIFTF